MLGPGRGLAITRQEISESVSLSQTERDFGRKREACSTKNNSLKTSQGRIEDFGWVCCSLVPWKVAHNGDEDSLVIIRPVHERADGEHVEMVLEIFVSLKHTQISHLGVIWNSKVLQ